MTFLELQTEVFRRLEENSVTPVYWTLAQIKAAINRGFIEISDATEWYETSASVPVSAGVYVANVETGFPGFLAIKALRNDQTGRWMRPATVRELDQSYMKWETATGEPDRYTIRAPFWIGFDRAVTGASSTLTLYYTSLPTELADNSDIPAFPQEFHLALVDFAVYDLLCQDRENAKALYFFKRYKIREEQLRAYVAQRESMDRIGVLGQ